MKGWITPQEAQERKLDFKFGWIVDKVKKRIFSKKYGFVEVRVQTYEDGMPAFDRAVYHESTNINYVVYGSDQEGSWLVGFVIEERPFADNPDGTPADPSIKFGQPCVMGFNIEQVAGVDAATREASEEAGTKDAVISVTSHGHHNPNPTFVATWSEIGEVEVDPSLVGDPSPERSERIHRVEFVTVGEALWRISQGEHEGVNYRSATANDAFFVWLTKHPSIMLDAALELQELTS